MNNLNVNDDGTLGGAAKFQGIHSFSGSVFLPARFPPTTDTSGNFNVRALINECAYALFEKQGRRDGRDVQDWLEAEHEVNHHLESLTVRINPKNGKSAPGIPSRQTSMNQEPSQHISTPERRVGTEPEKTARDREAALAAIPPPFADVVSDSEWEKFNRDLFGLKPSSSPSTTQNGKEIQTKPQGDSNQ